MRRPSHDGNWSRLGDSTDAYNLGVEFYTGKCVKQSYENAAKMWEKAANSGVVSAKNNLGYLLSEGLGVEKDEKRAADLWQQAAKAGHAESQVHIGSSLFYGYGVPKDEVEGLAWVLRAIETAASDSGNSSGKAVVDMAQKQRSEMLAVAPTILPAAQKRASQLEFSKAAR